VSTWHTWGTGLVNNEPPLQIDQVLIIGASRKNHCNLMLTLFIIAVLFHVGFAQDEIHPKNICCYKFSFPQQPSFILPPAQPYSPGDVTLNPNNPIIMHDGTPLNPGQGCNGDFFEYYDRHLGWLRSYIGSDGQVHDHVDVFYATQSSINVRTIQTWQNNLADVLREKYARLWITCNNGFKSCVQFAIHGRQEYFVYPQCGYVPTPLPTSTYPPYTTTTIRPFPTTTPRPTLPPLKPDNVCCHKFQSPQLPSFSLPPVGPYSPGDVILNSLNPIVNLDGTPLPPGHGCTGTVFQYWTDQLYWTSSYLKDGHLINIDSFYVQSEYVHVRALQEWQRNMTHILNSKYARLWIQCNGGITSCVEFSINGWIEDKTQPICKWTPTPLPTITIIPTTPAPITTTTGAPTTTIYPTITTTIAPTQPSENNTCFKFRSPQLPSFTLPAADVQQDVTLNTNNPVILFDGSDLSTMRCVGSNFQYLDPITGWTSTYYDDHGVIHYEIDLFYIYDNNKLNAKVIRNGERLRQILEGRKGRIWISCDDNDKSSLEFTIDGQSTDHYWPTCPKKPIPRNASIGNKAILSLISVLFVVFVHL
jgi:hypothetical protein